MLSSQVWLCSNSPSFYISSVEDVSILIRMLPDRIVWCSWQSLISLYIDFSGWLIRNFNEFTVIPCKSMWSDEKGEPWWISQLLNLLEPSRNSTSFQILRQNWRLKSNILLQALHQPSVCYFEILFYIFYTSDSPFVAVQLKISGCSDIKFHVSSDFQNPASFINFELSNVQLWPKSWIHYLQKF